MIAYHLNLPILGCFLRAAVWLNGWLSNLQLRDVKRGNNTVTENAREITCNNLFIVLTLNCKLEFAFNLFHGIAVEVFRDFFVAFFQRCIDFKDSSGMWKSSQSIVNNRNKNILNRKHNDFLTVVCYCCGPILCC